MTLGSLCDGLGGWQLAAQRAGIKPIWSSEIDKYCCQITKRHFPDTIQLGDIYSIDSAPYVDIITAGTPCTSLSIAGKREGLKGESGLFFQAIKLIRRLNPQFFVWENVPGAFSSSRGFDFKSVLEEILQETVPLPKHGWANAGLVDGRFCQLCWRIFDAQHWGVPQRRNRIFLVADFGGRRAAKILFEPKSLPRDSEPCKKQTYQPAATAQTNAYPTILDISHSNDVVRIVKGDKTHTLAARMGTGGNQVQLIAYGLGRDVYNQTDRAKFNPSIAADLQPPLTACGAGATAYCGIIRKLTPVECERLQGLPDNWTAGISDTQRCKMLGNGMAQPIPDWIIQRIKQYS